MESISGSPDSNPLRQQQQTCVVCLTNEANVTYDPCRHQVVCASCDPILIHKEKGITCSYCRQSVLFRKYPTITLFVSLLSLQMIVLELPLNTTVQELKLQIQQTARLRFIPRITISGRLPTSEYHLLAELGVNCFDLVQCIPPPPPPIECLLHRLNKIRARIDLHKHNGQNRSDYQLNVAICQERERNVLHILKKEYGYEESQEI